MALHAAGKEIWGVVDVFLGAREWGEVPSERQVEGDHKGPWRLRGKENGKELPVKAETSSRVP